MECHHDLAVFCQGATASGLNSASSSAWATFISSTRSW
jgi:hypothetical protein